MTEAEEWKSRMESVTVRCDLKVVSEWWLDMWEWRTSELDAGRGNPYDFHPSYRAPWSMAVSKFPWLNVQDRIDLSPLVEAGMRERSKANPAMKAWLKDYLKEKRQFENS